MSSAAATAKNESWPTIKNPVGILRECCRNQAPVIILTVDKTAVCYHARLAALSNNAVTLKLTSPQNKPLLKDSLCCVSFAYRGDSRAFYSSVLEYRQKASPYFSQLVLALPSRIVGAEARMAYRVPVISSSGLTVSLTTRDGFTRNPRPVDLSFTGILLDFTEERMDPDLRIGAEVRLELCMSPHRVKLRGEILRHVGCRYGVFFSSVLINGCLVPPKELRDIVGALERLWLRKRISSRNKGREI